MTRLYLRNTQGNTSGKLSTTQSTALPVGTFSDQMLARRDLSVAKGTLQVVPNATTLAQTSHQDIYRHKAFSAQLTVATVDANTWTIALATSESNTNVNGFTVCSIYVLASDNTVRGYVYDSDAPLGAEYATSETGQVLTISGGTVTGVTSTDRLVFEWWIHCVQAMATAYLVSLYYDGTTDVTAATTTDAASYIETPQDIFAPSAIAQLLDNPMRIRAPILAGQN
jgi:uncharacterized membrane protein